MNSMKFMMRVSDLTGNKGETSLLVDNDPRVTITAGNINVNEDIIDEPNKVAASDSDAGMKKEMVKMPLNLLICNLTPLILMVMQLFKPISKALSVN